jgi:hypothetical protein
MDGMDWGTRLVYRIVSRRLITVVVGVGMMV